MTTVFHESQEAAQSVPFWTLQIDEAYLDIIMLEVKRSIYGLGNFSIVVEILYAYNLSASVLAVMLVLK